MGWTPLLRAKRNCSRAPVSLFHSSLNKVVKHLSSAIRFRSAACLWRLGRGNPASSQYARYGKSSPRDAATGLIPDSGIDLDQQELPSGLIPRVPASALPVNPYFLRQPARGFAIEEARAVTSNSSPPGIHC
jgi:hypothetical protein